MKSTCTLSRNQSKSAENKTSIENQEPAVLGTSYISMAQSSPTMMWITGPHNREFFINDHFLEFLGFPPSDAGFEFWKNAIHPKDRKNTFKRTDSSFEKKKPYKIEYRLRRYDDQYRWVMDNGAPQFDAEGNFIGYLRSLVDVHEIKELEHRKGQFITAASHELKTPVTSLKVYLHLIDEYINEHHLAPYTEYSHGAITQLNKITALIDQLLDLNRIQSSSLYFENTTFDFCELVDEVVKKMQLLHPQREITLQGDCSAQVFADYERLLQAIENLISNGIKYSAAKENGKVEVVMGEDTERVYLTVKDYGIGIAEKHLLKIFERFYRIPGKTEETFPGMGIGLYLTRKIIQKSGGEISVESDYGNFTEFTIKLPVSKDT